MVIWRAPLVNGITCRPATPGRLSDCLAQVGGVREGL